jgi:hypothetical protein
MLGLDERQRAILADKLADIANLVAGAIVVGFAIGEATSSTWLLAIAIAFWIGAVFGVVLISRDKL